MAEVNKESKLEMPVFDFPDWEVFIDSKKINHEKSPLLKRVAFSVPEGEHKIKGYLKDTPVRSFANATTLLSLIVLLFLVYGKGRKVFN